jgi:nitrite reductase/ring-hydroxylating ferredoxin subunit
MPEREVVIIPHNNGPYEVRGKVKLVTEGGRIIPAEEGEAWLCRCGHSASKPFCDGTHAKIGFRSDLDAAAPAADGFEDVCADSDLEEGEIRGVRVGGQPVVIGRVEGRVYAIGGVCTHQRALLEDGELDGKMVRCPLHDSGFDITNGKVLSPPATVAVPAYAVKVEHGRIFVRSQPR